MKILTSGNQPWARECICKNCQAKLLVEYNDLFRRWVTSYYDDGSIICFSCPECSEETAINYDGPNEKFIPLRVDEVIKINSTFNISSFIRNIFNW